MTTSGNQVSVGDDSSTYTLSGITSADSLAAQSGPIEVLTTDANGNLASDGGAFSAGLSSVRDDVDENTGGIALALATSNIPALNHGERISIGLGFGTFGGETGYAGGANIRITDRITARASFGGTSQGGIGGGGGIAISLY